jgi:UDP:flavonoid glycosyltransferase YjiC (YdhE family)
MGRVLFTWELGGGLGHTLPMLALVRALVGRGHRVYLALRDLAGASRVFDGMGPSLLQAPFRHSRAAPFEHTPSFAHVMCNTGFGDDRELHALVCAWRNLIGLARPDAIVADHSPTALLAARYFPEVKRIVTGLGFFCPPDMAPWPSLTRRPVGDDELLAHEAGVLARVNRLLARAGRPALERLGQLYGDADETFLQTFEELDHYPRRPAGAKYWGPVHAPGGVEPSWPTGGGGPRVFAYLKNSPAVGEVLAALAELGGPTVVLADGVDAAVRRKFEAAPASTSSRRATMRFETRRLDMAKVREACDLAVHNANHGTLCQLLLGGKPMVQVPLTLEQQVLARRVEALGAAQTMKGRAAEVGEEVRRKLHAVATEGRYAEAARRFAEKYGAFDPEVQVRRMVGRVEELLEGGRQRDGPFDSLRSLRARGQGESGRQGDKATRGQGAGRGKVFAG